MKQTLRFLALLVFASSAFAGNYVGDYAPGDTVDCNFGTVRPSTGASFTLAGTPAVSAYKDNSTTQVTTGITLSADFDGVTGLNHVRVTTASDGTHFSAGSFQELIITTGTVDSVSVVGQPVCSFTLRKGTIAGVPAATAGASGGLQIAGSNAATTYASVTVSGATVLTGNVSMAAGLNITQSSSNTPALVVTGNGTGNGATITSGAGATGTGLAIASGATNGAGATITGTGTGNGATFTSGAGATGNGLSAVAASTNGNGINTAGAGTGAGELHTGGATGHGISAVGGATSGNGFRAAGTAGNSAGTNYLGQGSAAGLIATGGATGVGIAAAGGATSGAGLSATSTSGAGISAAGGTAGAGILATGGATGHGVSAVGGATSGDGVRAVGTAGNSNAMNLVGQGSASGLVATGGATGVGIAATGGATSGAGLSATSTSGAGISAAGGTAGAGILATGGATGHGVSAVGGATSGDGVRAVGTAGNSNAMNLVGQGSASGLLATGGATGAGFSLVGGATSGNAMATAYTSPLGPVKQFGVMESGILQSATGTTAVLRSATSFVDSLLVGSTLVITGGTGAGQSRIITAWTNSSDTATVATWTTTPDNTSTYEVWGTSIASSGAAPTVAQIATGVWQDATAGDFTTASSIGKSLYTSGVTPGSNGGLPTVDANNAVKLQSGTGANQISLSSGAVLLQATQTGVTIPTVTNLTNAPTSGDFTATMKTSIGTAVAASAVASVTGNVGGNVTGSVGSIAAGGIAPASFATTAGPFNALNILRQGTAQSATGTTLVMDSPAAFADSTAIGMTLIACGSTQGYCQAREVTSNTGSSDTLTVGTWTVTPSGTITFYLLGKGPAVGGGGGGLTASDVWTYGDRQLTAFDEDSTTMDLNATAVGSVTGNVSGSVASVTGSVNSVVGAVGSVTGAVGSVTGNVGGNVTGSVGSVTGAVGSVTGNVGGNVTGSVGSVASGGIASSSFAADAITAAKVAPDVTTELQSGLATASALTAVNNAIAALNNLSANQVRDLVVEDQGNITLGCALAAIMGYTGGDIVTSGANSTYKESTGVETRMTINIASPGNRTSTITCPTYP